MVFLMELIPSLFEDNNTAIETERIRRASKFSDDQQGPTENKVLDGPTMIRVTTKGDDDE